jgi:hypothetical protein
MRVPSALKVRVTRPAFLAGRFVNFDEEKPRHLGREHALVVLGKNAVIETALAQFAIPKPEPEQIVAKLLAEEPFAAHVVKGGGHTGLEQLLGRDAGPALLFIEFIEERRELSQHGVDAPFDVAQGMIRRHHGVEVDDRQELGLSFRFSTHADPIVFYLPAFKEKWSFSTAC